MGQMYKYNAGSSRLLLGVFTLALLLLLSPGARARIVASGDRQDLEKNEVTSVSNPVQRWMLRSHRPDRRNVRNLVSSFQVETLKQHKNGADVHVLGSTKSTATKTSSENSSPLSSSLSPDYMGIVPRAFEQWPSDLPLPCVPSEENWIDYDVQNTPTKEGFLYIKLYKTGSSTSSGIDLRIARNVANRTSGIATGMCKCRYDHGDFYAPANRFSNRDKKKSFLWSVVREPTHRLISMFFHMQVSRRQQDPTDENFRSFVYTNNPEANPYYLKALHPHFDGFNHQHYDDFANQNPVQMANQIIQEYDFIGVTERLDETAVLIMLLLDLPMADILFLDAKHSGGYDDGGSAKHTCTYITPSFISGEMQAFFDSETWKEFIKWDLAFYEAANRSMDMTIEKLGVKKFQANLKRFHEAQRAADDQCVEGTRFPCSEDGTKNHETDCLWNDSGCGAVCLDKLATKLDLWG